MSFIKRWFGKEKPVTNFQSVTKIDTDDEHIHIDNDALYLANISLVKLKGIGVATAKKLNADGIMNFLDLARYDGDDFKWRKLREQVRSTITSWTIPKKWEVTK